MSKLYTTKEAVKFFKEQGTPFTHGTLEVWRSKRTGPSFIKIRNRVFYQEKTLRQFIHGTHVQTID